MPKRINNTISHVREKKEVPITYNFFCKIPKGWHFLNYHTRCCKARVKKWHIVYLFTLMRWDDTNIYWYLWGNTVHGPDFLVWKEIILFEYQVKIIFLAFLSSNTYTIFNRMVNTFISINVSEVILCWFPYYEKYHFLTENTTAFK